MGDDNKTLQPGFHMGVDSYDLTTRPVQLGPGRVNMLVHPSPCVEIAPVYRDGVITEHKYKYADGTVLVVPVAEDIAGTFTTGALRS